MIYEKGSKLLAYLAIKYKGDWDLIYNAIITKEMYERSVIDEEISKLKCKFVTALDNDYPFQLKNIYKAPFVLFYYGDITLAQNMNRCLAVVGSRNASDYGLKMTRKILEGLCPEKIIVSGMAVGIDAEAHRSAIRNFGKTIAVLGCGIDYCYPSENLDLYLELKENHLILSEIPNKEFRPIETFAFRNRIITGLCKGVLVPEIHPKSGTNISVNFALQQDREIMIVPYRADENSESNRIIKQGANLVESAEDVTNVLDVFKQNFLK